MKKIIIPILLLLFSYSIKADQLSYISKSQADSAIISLKQHQKILLWCACCDNDPKIVVTIQDIKIQFADYKELYQIKIIGIDSSGNQKKYELDLAYVHILKDGKWYCLGEELGFKCDPCTMPFK